MEVKSELSRLSQLVEPKIRELLSRGVEDKNVELANYQCSAGGKRIRPALLIFCGQIFGCGIDELLYPAAAVEILHNSTLIIDDIIDHSDFRRDLPTCWNKYGTSMAECASFYYLASVYEGLSHANNSSRLVDLYSSTLKQIIDGEIKDILFERSGREDEKYVVDNRYASIKKDDYFSMIGQKTAILLKMSCMAGAICANASESQISSVGSFGFNLGMAFQIRDDILDIFGDEKEFGKKIGKDIIEKKMGNIVILTAAEELGEDDRAKLNSYLESESPINGEGVAVVKALIDKTSARASTESLAGQFINKALESLNELPSNEYKDNLVAVANYIVDRKS